MRRAKPGAFILAPWHLAPGTCHLAAGGWQLVADSYTALAFSVTTRTVLSTTCKNPPSTLKR